ncbi:hypothetical protein BDZ91DRAFT_749635 [Kalaharituber pfeilii]|nr:hypothetical protein BDZ91DRAFT_749635 [Kalaharituber pfeilii]
MRMEMPFSPKAGGDAGEATGARGEDIRSSHRGLPQQIDALTQQVDALTQHVNKLMVQNATLNCISTALAAENTRLTAEINRLARIHPANESLEVPSAMPRSHRLGMVRSAVIDNLSEEKRSKLVNDIRSTFNGLVDGGWSHGFAEMERISRIFLNCFERNKIPLECDWTGRKKADVVEASNSPDVRLRMTSHYAGSCFDDEGHRNWYTFSEIIKTFHRVAEYVGAFEDWS